jgi:hypothetical protein
MEESMGRIRTVKPELFLHSELFDAEKDSKLPLRLAWIALFTACDREGRFRWKPRDLKVALFPHDTIDFARVLDALHTRGFLVKYVNDGKEYGYIPSWHDHQSINNRESESVNPDPFDASSTRDARGSDATITPLSGREGKGKERKGREEPFERPDWVPESSWQAFENHRQRIGKPMTDHARRLAVKELEGLKEKGHEPSGRIDEAILKGWQTFYEPKHYSNGQLLPIQGKKEPLPQPEHVRAYIEAKNGGALL